MMADPKILVIRLSALGDVLFTLPAVHALKAACPGAEIDWLIEERAAALLDLYGGLRRKIVWRRAELSRQLHRPFEWPRAVASIVRHLGELRRERYDLVLDFHGNWRSGSHAWLSRGDRRIGFARTHRREGIDLLFHETVTPPDKARHRVDRAFALARAVAPGIPDVASPPPLVVPAASRAFAQEMLAAAGFGEEPYVVLHPGTSKFGAIKRWAAERFAHVGDLLNERRGVRVLVTFGPGEEELARAVVRSMKRFGGAVVPRVGTLADLAALLARARLVIAGDTAALHLGALLGTPVVGLYGPKDPAIYGPRFAAHRVVHTWLPCSPCTRRTCPDVLCMDEIGVRQVFEAATALLDAAVTSRSAGAAGAAGA